MATGAEYQGVEKASRTPPSFRAVVIKSIVTHTVTYFVFGLLALFVFDYAHLFAETDLRFLMRPVSDPLVMAGPMLQPIRGFLFGVLLFVLRETFFGTRWGWLRLWLVLLVFGIVGPPGPVPGSLEGLIYTTLPIGVQLKGLPEVVFQTLAFSWILCTWVDHPRTRWIGWCLGFLFALEFVLVGLGMLVGRAGMQ
jgi:hypothetical protein